MYYQEKNYPIGQSWHLAYVRPLNMIWNVVWNMILKYGNAVWQYEKVV